MTRMDTDDVSGAGAGGGGSFGMTETGDPSRAWRDWAMPVALVVLIVAVLAATWMWVDGLRLRSARSEVRGATASTATPYAGSLTNALAKRLALVRGLTAFVTVEVERGDLEEEFARFADALHGSIPGIRNISVAPDFVIGLVYPGEGNAKVIGNELLHDPRPGFADTVRRAISSRGVATHGPITLIQGGVGLIARQAIFQGDRAWGAVGAVFDLTPIIEEANLAGLSTHYAFALRRVNGRVFAGDPAVFGRDPVIEHVSVPDGDWQLAVVPVEGWDAAIAARADRGPIALGFFGVALLSAVVVLLLAERRATLARQVTERTRDLVAARRDADRKAEQLAIAQHELERFAFAAAHDLQEPVRTMGGYAQLLQREIGPTLDEERRALLGQVVEGARRLKALLHDVQIFVAEGALPLPDGSVPADVALDDALSQLARRIEFTGAEVTREPLPMVVADQRRLREIFVALIGNALEYRDPDRALKIHIGARVEGAVVALSVRDNGIGIEPCYHEQIFEVFRRLHGRDAHPGTGMGLAIARKMAERLGGGITLSSTPGRGSEFTVCLPVALPGMVT